MVDTRVTVLSLVERGWHATRLWSLDAESRGVQVIHLIKGRLSPSVLAMIAPRPNIRIVSVPQSLFWIDVFIRLFTARLHGGVRAVLVDNDRSRHRLTRWARWMGVELLSVRVGAQGYEVWGDAGRTHL